MTLTVDSLIEEFNRFLGTEEWRPSAQLRDSAHRALQGCNGHRPNPLRDRENWLLYLVNSKLRLNRESFQLLLDSAANHRRVANYHEKAELQRAFDRNDQTFLKQWIEEHDWPSALNAMIGPVSRSTTLEKLHLQLESGAVSRKDARDCPADERRDEVLSALFGGYVFGAFPREAMHCFFNQDSRDHYEPDFYKHLLKTQPSVLRRDCALIYLNIDDSLTANRSYEELRDAVLNLVEDAYNRLANHCFLAIRITPFGRNAGNGQWSLFSDLVLFAEKHREIPLKTGYFKPDRIAADTAAHITDLDLASARFDIANEGFSFKDCFILSSTKIDTAVSDPVDLLILFDKNERDETQIPCPECRSSEVAGNSYPSLGVKSWECQNSICPARSAFNRGYRYSVAALIKQEAIESDPDQIPMRSLKRWKLDVVFSVQGHETLEMLIRHFTLHGDRVLFVNSEPIGKTFLGRSVCYESFVFSDRPVENRFKHSAFFNRFAINTRSTDQLSPKPHKLSLPNASIFHGDCISVLSGLSAESIDGAVTSPPYYNARSYATWPNIYCYLHDMYRSSREVFRVLKPGAYYLFNIFDYFDNENVIVSSAMGKKRMILGAYIIDLFERIGFELIGNTIWYKGEIEGKRNFNQGNRSPYYQYPFNCWEHILIFRKTGGTDTKAFPTILNAKPVIKMVRGKNVLGHTAPFPPAIPDLLISQMKPGEVVLDPYGGSMTTARVAREHGVNSISIELHEEYCLLGARLLSDAASDGKPQLEMAF